MIEKIIVWGLLKSGFRSYGNYIRIDGKLKHKRLVVMEFMAAFFLMVFTIGGISIIWLLLDITK